MKYEHPVLTSRAAGLLLITAVRGVRYKVGKERISCSNIF
jgi:hypothetical protein